MSDNSTTAQRPTSRRRPRPTLRSVALGVAGLVGGVLVGFVVGANVGGNWMTGLTIGGLRGYEATAWLGAAAGGVVAGVVWFLLSRSRRSR